MYPDVFLLLVFGLLFPMGLFKLLKVLNYIVIASIDHTVAGDHFMLEWIKLSIMNRPVRKRQLRDFPIAKPVLFR